MSVNAVNSDGSLSKIAGGINTNDTDIIKSDLSYVEPYTTATAAHAQGDCFVMNTGQLVRATSAINIGDTITLNTNVSAVSIIELLAEKVDKVTGKGLSTNDYTDKDKATTGKLALPNTVVATDKTPFLSRQALSPEGFTGYVREKLIGASYAWNQLVQNDFVNNYTKVSCIVGESSGVYTLTKSGSQGLMYKKESNVIIPVGHIILIKLTGLTTNVYASLVRSNSNTIDVMIDANKGYVIYQVVVTDVYGFGLYLNANLESSVSWKTYQCIDLTLTFGNDIANHIYSLEQATAGSGITKLRDMGFSIDKYTPYGYGLYSVKTSGKKIVGFNIWDEEWELGAIDTSTGQNTANNYIIRSTNYISCLPSTTYFRKNPQNIDVFFYSADKSYLGNYGLGANGTFDTPSNCYYMRFYVYALYGTTYNHDICINISDSSKNGTYEPYCGYEISIGNDELRGKFDLVNGEIVASGDVKESNGEITRNWKLIDLGDLTWYYDSSAAFFYCELSTLPEIINNYYIGHITSKYVFIDNDITSVNMSIQYYSNYLRIRFTDYTDANTFKTAMTGVKMIYKIATPTIEQSTPFADPMSLIGATTEEYIDTRDVPCPVGAERQYMSESDDVVEFPSSPMSDGKRVLTSYKSGDEEKLVWEDSNNVIEFYVRTHFTSAAQLTYTGVSVTIPKGKHFAFSASAIYANARPEEIYISYSNDPTLTYLICAGGARGGASHCGYIRTSDRDTTFYIHARYNGIATNRIDISGYYF